MPGFDVFVIGVGDAFSEKNRTSALLLACDGFFLAVDCPDSYRGALRAAAERSGNRLSLADVDHVLITHLHGDHVNGLEGAAYYKHFAQGRRVKLVTSPQARAAIWDQRLSASMGTLWDGARFHEKSFDDYFDYLPLEWQGETTVGPFRIRARRTIHHIPTSALFVEANGRSLGFSSDTAFDPELIRFLEPADLMIHETNLGPAHTPYSELAALPAALRRKMRLIHYPDDFDLRASSITPLFEGEVVRP